MSIVKDHNGRRLILGANRLQEPNGPDGRYAITFKEFRRAYRSNDTLCRIEQLDKSGKIREGRSLKVVFRKPAKSGSNWMVVLRSGRIGCSFFSKQDFFRIYRAAFKSATKKARAAKAGAN